MKTWYLNAGVLRVAVPLCLSGALIMPVWADDPPQEGSKEKAEQAEAPQQEKSSSSQGSSLADAAGRIKLQLPTASEGSGVVISDQNLKQSGAGAAVSQGSGAKISGASAGVAAQGEGLGSMTAEESALANDIVQRYHAQLTVVQGLEVRLANFDRQLAEASPDPHYKNYSDSPQNRAPGVVDAAQGKRDLLADNLDRERKKLADIRKEAKRAGVTLSEPTVQPAAPVPPG